MGLIVSKIAKCATLVVALVSLAACVNLQNDDGKLQIAAKTAYAASSPLTGGVEAPPPPGFVGFCMRSPSSCAEAQHQVDAQITFNDQTAATLVSVNNWVNDSITYKSDIEHYGVENRWTLDAVGGYGDCKDYALAKREMLRIVGLPEAALRIAIVRTPEGVLHAVLTVETDKGTIVLDSLTPTISAWSETPYKWLSRQSSIDPLRWESLSDERVTSNSPSSAIGAGSR